HALSLDGLTVHVWQRSWAWCSGTPDGSGCASVLFLTVPASTEFYTLSLHDALPISRVLRLPVVAHVHEAEDDVPLIIRKALAARSEEHTSELQSRENLVCRLRLEKKSNS